MATAQQRMSFESSVLELEPINAYEQIRLKRIAENQAKLQSLGLQQAVNVLRKPERRAKPLKATCTLAKSQHPLKHKIVTRQAARTRRSPREDIGHTSTFPTPQLGSDDDEELSSSESEGWSPPSRRAASGPDTFTNLNQYRISTMSEAALRNRIRQIRNVAKMRNFIEELEESLPHLASEAKAALRSLTGPDD